MDRKHSIAPLTAGRGNSVVRIVSRMRVSSVPLNSSQDNPSPIQTNAAAPHCIVRRYIMHPTI